MAKPVALTASYPSPERKEKKYAYFRKFTLPTGPKSTFQSVLTILDNFVFPALTDYQITTGLRNLVRLDGSALEAIAPLLLQIVSAAIKNVSFPLKQPIIEDVTLIIAPKTSCLSNSWTPGKIHRDFLDVDVTGVYSFMLFLHKVTTENGAIEYWKDSKLFPVDDHHPERAMTETGAVSKVMEGPEGTVYAFDARVLHRSLPNKTGKWRLTLQWIATGINGTSINIIR
jgi:hypothetical protein